MSLNRSFYRNVSFYDAANPDENVVAIYVERGHRPMSYPGETGLLKREFTISTLTVPPIELSREVWVEHTTTHIKPRREARLRHGVPNRDRKCVISGTKNPEAHIQADTRGAFEACHISPRQHESLWHELGYGKYVTGIEDTPKHAKINSSQNGLTHLNTIRTILDQ
ncbi:hypothetical protein HOY82DRAFT_606377 [Tuber indicum]|nr:hypothetical protein HOY82DRAFT_606377 [Tuber indicum]